MNAVITGAGIRVGRAIALELAEHGFDVVIHCRSSVDEAESVARACRAFGVEAHVVTADLATVEGCRSLVEQVGERWSSLDVLVNNASVFQPIPFADIDVEHWEWMQNVNSRAPFLLAQGLLPMLRESTFEPTPAIVNLVDIGVERPLNGYLAYSVSKIGIQMLTKALAIELAPAIRTMGVAPGQVIWPEDYSEEKRTALAQRIPMKRCGTPEDVAKTVRFLVKEGAYLNGAIVPVDGGLQHRY